MGHHMAKNFGAELITIHVIPSEVVDLSLKEGKDWDAIRGEVSAQTYLLADEISPSRGRLPVSPDLRKRDRAEEPRLRRER